MILLYLIVHLFPVATNTWLARPGAHDIHLTNCSTTYLSETQSLEISVTIFTDDFEDALSKMHGKRNWNLCREDEFPETNSFIESYLSAHLQFGIADRPVSASFIRKEPTEGHQAVVCYLKVTDIGKIKDITIKNSLLLELFDDQKNILNIGREGSRRQHVIFDHRMQQKKISI